MTASTLRNRIPELGWKKVATAPGVTRDFAALKSKKTVVAENRTRGPTMATLDFTTKPLPLVVFGEPRALQIR